MNSSFRANSSFLFFTLFLAVILYRLIFLQVLKGDYYKALSQGLYNYSGELGTAKGEIFLKNGEPLAINLDFPLVFASPKKIKDLEKTAQILSQTLNLEENFISEKLKTDNFYSVIKKKLSQEEVAKLKDLNLEGISVGQESGRYYPQEELASQVTGFLGAEGKGQYGLEEFYEEILSNEKNFEDVKESKNSPDLILTIDYNIQFEAEKLLKEAKGNLDIEGGQIIVIAPDSGKIIALANFPNFNPNSYQEYAKEGNLGIFMNGATQALFEPGSVFKPITMSAALEEEKISPKTTYIDKGFVKIGSYPISNYALRVYGEQTMTNVLEKSINTGAIFAEQQIGHKTFLDYVEKFGLFEPTGIDIPEIYSENMEFKKGYEINFATAAFGQGIEMTPIQLTRAYCAIANGGNLIRPYLVEKISENGKEIETQPQISRRILSPKTTSQLTAMLVSVVENGFGKAAKIPKYYIAGKTGTSQMPWSIFEKDKRGYSDKTWQTFVGFGPAFNPQFLILVKLDNPKAKTAEYSALPIFHALSDYIIRYWQIPPDYE